VEKNIWDTICHHGVKPSFAFHWVAGSQVSAKQNLADGKWMKMGIENYRNCRY
jgi:hypothetical protein